MRLAVSKEQLFPHAGARLAQAVPARAQLPAQVSTQLSPQVSTQLSLQVSTQRRTRLRSLLLKALPGLPATLLCALLLAGAGAPAMAAPSTFGPVIGSAILCRSHLDNAYFHSYLSAAFGPSYKHEGGAYWFKADGTLWGAPVTDIIISDDTSELVFVGAVTETTPDKLEEAIRGAVGVPHPAKDASRFPVRESSPGSKIVYFNSKSKIYCAKYKPLPVRQ